MSKQPEALRLADALDNPLGAPLFVEAAAELRRLHAENEALRESLKTEELISFRRQMQQYAAQVEAGEALLRQALEALETHVPHYLKDRGHPVITAIRQHLEGQP